MSTATLAVSSATLTPSAWAQFLSLTKRSVLAYRREPSASIFPLVFPLFFAGLSSSSFDSSTSLPGFPDVNSFIDFLLAATITQSVLFGCSDAGIKMATDIQGGFFDRLLTSPASRAAVLGSRLASAFIYACLQTTLVLITLSLFGARVAAGWVGYPLLVFYGGVVGLAGAALMLAFAIRSGQSEVVQSLFPLVFLVLFLSSAFFPVTLMNGWWQTAAEYSPITALVDGARAICIDGLEWGPFGKAIGVAAVLGTLTSLYAASSLRKRLRAS